MNAAVLLAEPEPSTREFLQRHLADDGFDVLGAETEREALELAETPEGFARPFSSPELCCRLRDCEPGRSWDREVPARRARCGTAIETQAATSATSA